MPVGHAIVLVRFGRTGTHEIQRPVPYASLSDQLVGELAYACDRTLEQNGLDAVRVVKVRVHRGYRELMVSVLQPGQAFGKLAFVVVVNVGKVCDAAAGAVAPLVRALQLRAQDVAHGFTARRVAALANELVKGTRELFVQGYREAFHEPAPY